MPRYLVERTLEPGSDVSADTDSHGGRIVEGYGEDVTWLHSYVSDDGRGRSASTRRRARKRSGAPPRVTSCRSSRSRRCAFSIRTRIQDAKEELCADP